VRADDPGRLADVATESGFSVRPVSDEQRTIVAWLWQAYRHDLATIVNGLPYADGRYQAALLDGFPMADGAAYLAWRAHPRPAKTPQLDSPLSGGSPANGGQLTDSGYPVRAAKESAPNSRSTCWTTRGTVDDCFSTRQHRCGDILAAHRERSLRARTVVRGDSSGTDASRSATGPLHRLDLALRLIGRFFPHVLSYVEAHDEVATWAIARRGSCRTSDLDTTRASLCV